MSVTALYGGQEALAAPVKPAAGKPKPAAKPAAAAAADIKSAKVAARLNGKRVEALSERTETSTTWVNPDGTLTTEMAAGPIRFRDEATHEWRDVDLDLVQAADGSVGPKAHPRGLRLGKPGGQKLTAMADNAKAAPTDLVTLGTGEEQITLQWKGGLPAPKLAGTRATYEDAVPQGDVVVEATRTGFEQFVEVKSKPGAGYSYTLPIRTKGLDVAQQADGSLLFTDKKSNKTAAMPAPMMWDATVDPVSGEHTHRAKVAMKAVKTSGGVDLVVTPDAGFLADPKTAYPVTVDPSTSSLGSLFDTYVQQGETVDWSADTELDLGNPGTKNADGTFRTARSFITWNTAPISDALVSSAKLSLWNFHSGNTDCQAYPWEVWSAGAATTASRWTNQPAMTTKYATSTQTKGNPTCTAAPDGWIDADVTSLVQSWASAKANASSMGLRASSEAVTTQWKRVNSANAAANPPKLVVTYNYRPRTGTKQEAGPPFYSYGGAYTVNTLTPTLRDTFIDANGDKVDGTFQIFDSATDTQVGNVLVSPFVGSGEVASVTVPAGVLAEGKTYKFRTSPYDGTSYNLGWSAWKTFTVDTKAPAAPVKVTSTDYPTDKWVKGAGQTGTFTVTPPAGDHNWLEWSLDGVSWTKTVTGGAAADVSLAVAPPRDGNQTLQVRAVDKADNKSEPVQYAFHAGPGGFAQPGEGERTARRLPLVAEADSTKYDQVSFSWRRSDADPWVQIPAGDVTKDGQALAGWPVPLTGGKNAPLVWNAINTVDPDGSVKIKADFTGPNSASGSTNALSVVVNRNGDDAAGTDIGPGSLNLLTGDFTMSSQDASSYGISVGRTASSRDPQAAAKLVGTDGGQVPIFGKEWLYGAASTQVSSPYGSLVKTSATSLSIRMIADDTQYHFTANQAKTAWIPEAWLSDYTLTGDFGGNFTLRDNAGRVTTFVPVESPNPQTWRASTSYVDGLNNSTTTTVTESVQSGGKTVVRPKLVIAPTSAVTAAACQAAPATKGCRAVEFVYADTTTATAAVFGDFAGQVREVRQWATDPGAASATAVAVSTYRYDDQGRLRQQWDPRLPQPTPTEYGYDSAGRVVTYQTKGEKPWTLTYAKVGATGADGMLTSVRRAALAPGSVSTEQGESASTVVYDVPTTGAAAPYKMGAADVLAWGQTNVPSDATAVFPADSVPSGNSGAALGAGDYTRATVHYLGVSGQPVNTAAPGGSVTTTENDRFGNTVRQLSAANRSMALGLTAADRTALAALGVDGLSTAERAELLSVRKVYSADGGRELQAFGPLRRVDLTADLKSGATTLVASGTPVTARPWTVTAYDEGRPTDGSAAIEGQVTTVTDGAQVREYPGVMGEAQITKTEVDWVKGLPTKSVEDPAGQALTTQTEYDAQGRVSRQILPGATATEATSRFSTYWSATGTGTCQGRPEWADLLCSTGPSGAITGGGTNPAQLPTSTYEYDRWGNVTKTTETANGVTRTNTTAFDAAGRAATSKVTGGLGQAVPDVTNEYDPVSGRLLKTTAAGASVARAYDKLGRQISYSDADGGTTTSEYDQLDRPVKVSDSVPSSVTYTYDHAAEPRGLAVKATDSVAGAFSATYNADGALVSEKLPGGYTMNQTRDAGGDVTVRSYLRDSDGVAVLSDTVAHSAHGQLTRHTGWSDQVYRYDGAGRIASVQDTADTVCTMRSYTFDKRANRTGLTTATAAPGTDCPTSGGTTATQAFDSADRLVSAGYTYDAFGRTTAFNGGATAGYYANDLVYQQTGNGSRQTWLLDPAYRFRSTLVESGSGTTWTQTASRVNHYGDDGDSPRWITENTGGAVSRVVESLGGSMGAITSKTGDIVLQMSNIHGDVALQLPLDTSVAPTALDNDEYGNPRSGQAAVRYGWLGEKQRSAETPSGVILMGARLYNPSTGRFLSLDPVYAGSANAYEYCSGDPVNCTDLDGRWSRSKTWSYSWGRLTASYWAPGGWGTGWGGVNVTVVVNKRNTWRIGNYSWFIYGVIGAVAAILSVIFVPAAPIIIILSSILTLILLTIQAVAYWASNRGECLHLNMGASIWNKWWVPRYMVGRYAYPWRGRC
ncbi:RHS repeat-associated core domain-containing protein [Streptomyces sp. ISL-66]|uniref:DNRLRE domain-containing protein n=1 Tax=Streptomyces sp. ISL-66 TaxID=2819186 RepID=UPI001BECBAC8|nr:DNRLRE domain-containing protein [Streptomyces sp. ISL-66]MBT2469656.1 RHS repeat-associated core domain-containing protein [Streptomyces sp. ISL-66]